MTVIPSLPFSAVIAALERAGWIVTRQKGSHIRLKKFSTGKVQKLTVPAHRPIKRSTLAKIIKQADMNLEEFLRFL
jgi:predicted RNA binding protein YcfA (HicA-like mRNA interferase family)